MALAGANGGGSTASLVGPDRAAVRSMSKGTAFDRPASSALPTPPRPAASGRRLLATCVSLRAGVAVSFIGLGLGRRQSHVERHGLRLPRQPSLPHLARTRRFRQEALGHLRLAASRSSSAVLGRQVACGRRHHLISRSVIGDQKQCGARDDSRRDRAQCRDPVQPDHPAATRPARSVPPSWRAGPRGL